MRRRRLRFALTGLLLAFAVTGCARSKATPAPSPSLAPTVQIVRPQTRDIVRTVGQPGFIEAYEQTALYAKIPGYIQEWKVDLGDRVKKDQLLLELSVPELTEEHELKKAQVTTDQVLVQQAEELVAVAESNLKAAAADVATAKATVGRFQAEVERWESEVKRLTALAAERIVDKQVLDESQKQLKSNKAGRDAALAAVESKEASRLTAAAQLSKSRIDVDVARAKVKVSQADERRLAALVGYTRITAPYDGVITLRNANRGDFVLPATGDPSAARTSPNQSAAKGTPLYVVARTDVVRVFVDVPGQEAAFVAPGTKATVRLQSLGDEEIAATVTRTSWALLARSRTLRAEIDLPNTQARLLPNMYAYGRVLIDQRGVRAVPAAAITDIGNERYCYLLQDGKAVRTAVQTGLSDGTWIALLKKRVDPAGSWTDITGAEEVILGDLSELTSGQQVVVGGKE